MTLSRIVFALALPGLVAALSSCRQSGLASSHDGGSSHPPLVHRPAPTTCPQERPAYNCGLSGGGAGPPSMCRADSDCVAGADGRCVGNSHDGCSCSYDTCSTDGDCPTGQLCDCRDAWHYGANGPNRCLPGNCRVDADCGPGGYCSPTLDPGCGAYFGVSGWYCHTERDACTDDRDCTSVDGGFTPPYCGYHPELGSWACSTTVCAG